MKNTFEKHERLNSKKLIDQLFTDGHSFLVYPFKVVHLKTGKESNYPAQILVSVSKRYFKKAVDRNRIKRLIREAYRTNKQLLLEQPSGAPDQWLIGLIYIGKTIPDFAQIDSKIILILQRLIEQDEKAVG